MIDMHIIFRYIIYPLSFVKKWKNKSWCPFSWEMEKYRWLSIQRTSTKSSISLISFRLNIKLGSSHIAHSPIVLHQVYMFVRALVTIYLYIYIYSFMKYALYAHWLQLKSFHQHQDALTKDRWSMEMFCSSTYISSLNFIHLPCWRSKMNQCMRFW